MDRLEKLKTEDPSTEEEAMGVRKLNEFRGRRGGETGKIPTRWKKERMPKEQEESETTRSQRDRWIKEIAASAKCSRKKCKPTEPIGDGERSK